MKKRTGLPKQTKEWENACINTRRNPEKRKKRLSVFNISKKDKVLDLGCGDGLNTFILMTMGIKNIVGVDISNDLIKIAKENNPKVKFYKASAEKIPFKKNAFDVVMVDSVFHHLMSYGKPVGEIKRVLKNGGRLCFMEPHKSFFRYVYDKVCEMPISQHIPFLKKRSKSYMGEIVFMKHWIKTEHEFYEELTRQGFKKILEKEDLLSIIGIYEISKTS